jgi:tau tubulin kinase
MESLKPPSIQRSYSDVDKLRTNDLDDNNKRSLSDSHINNDRKRSMSDVSLAVKDIINDTWEIKKKVGKGSFCELFVAKNILPPSLLLSSSTSSSTSITTTTSLLSTSLQYCAIKINNDDTSVLRAEGDILRNLCNINNVPSYITHGKHEGRDYIVMELLSGDDMSKVRDRIRLSSPTGLIPLNIATYFAHQMFLAVEAIHKRGYIHRDIKPANFVQRNNNSSDFCVVDFGMAKQFRDKDGTIKPKREKAEFRGTTVYASPNASMGDDQCPRDDLYSIIFVLLDLLCGKLPWSEASRNKDKPKVIALKQEYVSNDPKVLIDWAVNTIKVTEDKKKVSTINNDNDNNNTTTSIECLNFPKCAQDSVLEILKELRSLEYESIPDYHKIETAILGMIPTGTIENVKDINYKCEGFEWRAGFDKLEGIDEISYDTNQQQKGNHYI